MNGSMVFDEIPEVNNLGELDVNGKNSVYVCRHKIRNGDRNQSYRRIPDPMMEVYHKNKEFFDGFNVNLDKGIIVDDCFKANRTTLQRTMITEDVCEYSGYSSIKLIRLMKGAIRLAIRKL